MDQTRPSSTPPHVPSLAQSIHCFRTAGPERPRRSRSRFTPEEREKVLGVRRQGACLRCRILKIQCSLENPCQPCLQSAVKGSERKVLSFCYCVRTRFADVNIFDSASRSEDAATMQTETLLRTMSSLLARIAIPANFALTLSPAAFNSTMISWLTDPDFHLPNGSIVGLCCSSLLGLQFQDETTASTDGLITDFRRFLLATSLAHAGWRAGSAKTINPRELCAASQISGCRLIKRLDRILTPQFLSRCGRESCQVLFLLVLGAVLGVGYSSTQMLEDQLSPELPSTAAEMLNPEFQRSPTLWLAMKEHLCQMLAHHLIFLGSMLGIKFETGLEQNIIDTAVSRWNKAESFVWADVVGLERDQGRFEDALGPVELPGVVKSEEADPEVRDRGLPLYEGNPSPASAPHPPPPGPRLQLVSIPCPEIKQFQPRTVDDWSSNPQSYFAMFEGPPEYTRQDRAAQQESFIPRTAPESGSRLLQASEQPRREKKRRSIWVVRPYDAGPGQGLVNVHARVQGGMGMDTIHAFV
ncbi:hypothetical protein VTI74DRAFT_2607 [Chaetomium olivicolor]